MRKLSTGFLALAAMSLITVGCSSDSKPGNTTGTGGTASGSGGSASGSGGSASGSGGSASGSGGSASGSGGSASGSGGSASGSGGSASGSGGSTGTGGTVPTDAGADAPASCIVPTAASGLVSDFAATAAANLQTGGTDAWKTYPTDGMPMVTVAGGEMHAQNSGPWASVSTAVAGFGSCVNLSKYTGVKFKIKSATNTSLIFQVAARETEMASNHYRAMITVTAAYTDVTVPFASLMPAPFGVNPPAGFKPHERAYGLAFGVLAMTEKLDIFLDDVTFY
jgi:hypothetical protein